MIGIYFVITFFGQVAAIVGPIPSDMSQCLNHRDSFIDKKNKNFDKEMHAMNDIPHAEFNGQNFTNKEQIQAYCIETDQRPKLGDFFDPTKYGTDTVK